MHFKWERTWFCGRWLLWDSLWNKMMRTRHNYKILLQETQSSNFSPEVDVLRLDTEREGGNRERAWSPFWGSVSVASCQNVLRLHGFVWAGCVLRRKKLGGLVLNTQQVGISTGCRSLHTNVSFDGFIQKYNWTICSRSVSHVVVCISLWQTHWIHM